MGGGSAGGDRSRDDGGDSGNDSQSLGLADPPAWASKISPKHRLDRTDGLYWDYYERQGNTVRKYYYAGGQRIAVRVNGTLYFLHSDHLGSTTLLTNQSQQAVARRWYYPYGEERYAIGALPTDRLYTGQRWDGALALYDYRARYYDPLLGRFISADPLVPEPGNPRALNRYAYVYNNPLRCTDPSGRCVAGIDTAICIAVGLVLLKVIDYGWTAYDVYQSGQVLADPNAGRGEKLLAGLNIALAVAFEVGEPDDEIPVSLPLDDVGRRAMVAGARRALAEGGEEALERYLRERLGSQADEVLGWVMREVGEETAEACGGTYMLVDRVTGEVKYVGHTNNLARRAAEHARDPIKGQLRFIKDWRVDDYAIRRGREQMLYDQYRPPLNRIRPISPRNPRLQEYLDAARRFGELVR